MSGKVYCDKCKYLNIITMKDIANRNYEIIINYDCIHIDNEFMKNNSNWLKEEKMKKCKIKPGEINKHNDCKWYIQK